MRAAPLAYLAAVTLAVATGGSCGGEGTPPDEPSAGGGGAGGMDEGWTLDNYCARAAPMFCAAVSSCCEEDFDYDADGCAARWTSEHCEPAVELARSGRLRFTPGEAPTLEAGDAIVERCFDAFASYASLCGEANYYDYEEWVDQWYVECAIFVGRSRVGEPCDSRIDCAGTGKPDLVACFNGTCGVGDLYQPGQACPNPGIVCDGNTYCNAPATGGWGTCVQPLPLGAPCAGIDDVADCGQEAHCDLVERVCKPNVKVTEGPCHDARSRECRSLACRRWAPYCAHPISWDDYPFLARVHLDDQLCGRPIGLEDGP